MAGSPEWGLSNAPGTHRCTLCGRTGLRLRHGKLRFHFATGLCGEICSAGPLPFDEKREGVKTHPQSCGCKQEEMKGEGMKARTVMVTIEIQNTETSLKDIKAAYRSSQVDGDVRTVQVNAVQRTKRRAKKR